MEKKIRPDDRISPNGPPLPIMWRKSGKVSKDLPIIKGEKDNGK